MKLTGSREVGAAPAVVWAALFDPEVLKACVPGCESMIGSVAEGFEAAIALKIGPVRFRLTGLVRFSDIEPGHAVTVSGEGKGGAAGFAKGGARVWLHAIEGGTRLDYVWEASVGGRLAELGGRILHGFAGRLAEDAFARFQRVVEGPDASAPEEPPPATGWFRRLIG
jgi:carbon monoxide dehydrogenase subunit G